MNDTPSTRPPNAGSTAVDLIVPTNLMAAAAFWTSVFGVLFFPIGFLLGPIGIFLAVKSKKAAPLAAQSGYGESSTTARRYMAFGCGGLATLLGIGFVVAMLVGMAAH